MFAYCGNNPVMFVDYEGKFSWLIFSVVLLCTPIGGMLAQAATSVVSYAGIAISSMWDEQIREDMNSINWNPFKDDVTETLGSEKVSFYKGVPVFRTDLERSGSYYAIFLKKGSDESELKHERGHNTQAMMMGILNYGVTIGIPSAVGLSERIYYERSWEITADMFGGVYNREHLKRDIKRGYWYLAISSLGGPVAYLFLPWEYNVK